jgi:hypothetical protein
MTNPLRADRREKGELLSCASLRRSWPLLPPGEGEEPRGGDGDAQTRCIVPRRAQSLPGARARDGAPAARLLSCSARPLASSSSFCSWPWWCSARKSWRATWSAGGAVCRTCPRLGPGRRGRPRARGRRIRRVRRRDGLFDWGSEPRSVRAAVSTSTGGGWHRRRVGRSRGTRGSWQPLGGQVVRAEFPNPGEHLRHLLGVVLVPTRVSCLVPEIGPGSHLLLDEHVVDACLG